MVHSLELLILLETHLCPTGMEDQVLKPSWMWIFVLSESWEHELASDKVLGRGWQGSVHGHRSH